MQNSNPQNIHLAVNQLSILCAEFVKIKVVFKEMRKFMNVLKWMIGLVLVISLLPTYVAAQEQTSFYVVTATDGATMTASANPTGMVVANLKQGARIQLIRQEDQWVKVDYKGRLGWVSSELIAPFTEDLLPVYSSYYKLLQNTNHIIYAMIADFTQDGIEDLYLITDANPSKGQYQEFIYSGDKVIYQKNRTTGVTILQNGADYYIWHHAQTNADKKYKLADLNNQAKTDYFEVSEGKGTYEITANAYLKSYFVVQSGNGAVVEQALSHEQVASKDYYGAELSNEYDESIYLENYTLSKDGETKTILERPFNELFSFYEKSKVMRVIYEDAYNSAALSSRFSFDVERVKQELLNLAQAVMPEKQIDYSDIEKETLQLKLTQSTLLEIPYKEAISRNAATYFQMVEQAIPLGLAGYDSVKFNKTSTEQQTTYNRDAVNAFIYNFYGVAMNDEEFNRLANDDGYAVDGELYATAVKETPIADTYLYRQWQGAETMDNSYVALKFEDFEMPQNVKVSAENESAILAGTPLNQGYVLFKRLPFKAGTKFVYIDTVDDLNYLNTDQYGTYENSLAMIQKFVAEQQTYIIEETPQEENEQDVEQNSMSPIEPQQQSKAWVLFLGLGILIATSAIMIRKVLAKRRNIE